MSGIYEALASVMADCDEVAKRDYNQQQNFKFRGVDAVINAVGPILRKHRVMVMPETLSVDYAAVKTSTGKDQTSCRVVVRYSFYAPDGSTVATTVAAESSDSGDKATPKAMSVAFRIALLQALALPTDSPDPDAGPSEPRKKAEAKAPAEQTRTMSRPNAAQNKMFALLGEVGRKDRNAALSYISGKVGRTIETRNDLTPDELSKVIKALEAEVAEQKETTP